MDGSCSANETCASPAQETVSCNASGSERSCGQKAASQPICVFLAEWLGFLTVELPVTCYCFHNPINLVDAKWLPLVPVRPNFVAVIDCEVER